MGRTISPQCQVKAILKQSAEDLFKKGCDEKSGFGLVSIPDALNRR
ncbi:hypothetical protein [Kroppenstedtia guangzhouensis]|jgi:hypothetical protein|nr:hypothetical protein [Kroppenstedtia guangzhouensis]